MKDRRRQDYRIIHNNGEGIKLNQTSKPFVLVIDENNDILFSNKLFLESNDFPVISLLIYFFLIIFRKKRILNT